MRLNHGGPLNRLEVPLPGLRCGARQLHPGQGPWEHPHWVRLSPSD